MFASLSPRPFPSLAVCLAVWAFPAHALEPKDGWGAIAAFLEGAGFTVSHGSFRADGGAIVADAVVISSPGSGDFRFEIPQLRIEPRDGALALIPSDNLRAVATDSMGIRRQFQVQHDAEFGLDLTDTDVSLMPRFDQMTVTMVEATRGGRPVDEAFSMALSGLEGQIALSLAQVVALQMDLDLERLDYTQRLASDVGVPMRQDSRGTADGLSITATGTGFEAFENETTLAAALEAGFALDVNGRSLRSTSSVEQTGVFDMMLRLESGDSTFQMGIAREGFTLGMDVFDTSIGYGPIGSGLDARLGRMDMRLEMPLRPTQEDQRFGLGMVLEGLAPTDTALAALGLAGFSGESVDFRLRMGAGGRWLRDLETIDASTDAPIDLGTLALEELLFRIGTATLTGAGDMAFAGGSLMGQMGDVPQGNGSFIFDLIGGEALLNRLGDAGLLPADELFVARMMIGAVGRSVGTDHVRSEITLREGEEPLINGLPIPF